MVIFSSTGIAALFLPHRWQTDPVACRGVRGVTFDWIVRRVDTCAARLSARGQLPHHFCACTQRVDVFVRLCVNGHGRCGYVDLAHQAGCRYHCCLRAFGGVFYLAGIGDRFAVGCADVGSLLGLGRTLDFRAGVTVFVSGGHRVAKRDRRPSRGGPGSRGAGGCWGDQSADHPLFGRVVDNFAPAGHYRQVCPALHARLNVNPAAGHGRRI